MGRISKPVKTLDYWIAWLITTGCLLGSTFILMLLTVEARGQTDPDKILAIEGGDYVSVTPEVAHDAGLPARTGKGGQCVKVASDASGFEYGECGSGRLAA